MKMNVTRLRPGRARKAFFVSSGLILLMGFYLLTLLLPSKAAPVASKKVPEAADPVTVILSRMSDREKIGQIIMVNFYGEDYDDVGRWMSEYGFSGLMLKSENVRGKDFEGVAEMNRRLKASQKRLPVFISVDQEGGSVARLDGVLKSYPAPSEIYASGGRDAVREFARYTAENLKKLGIEMNFNPVLDVPASSRSVVSGRCFASDPQENTALAQLVIQESEARGVISVPKHFPGYGQVSADPHYDICVDETEDLDAESKWFYTLSNTRAIMSAHVIFSRYDELPATLSRSILGKLRENRFTNVIITDDIQMRAITRVMDYRRAAVRAVNAGCDLVLSVTQDPDLWRDNAESLHRTLLSALQSGEISRERLDSAVERVLRMKLSLGETGFGILQENGKNGSVAVSAR